MSLDKIKKVTVSCIINQHSFVNIFVELYIGLFGYNFIFLDATVLEKHFKGKSDCPMSYNIFPFRFITFFAYY